MDYCFHFFENNPHFAEIVVKLPKRNHYPEEKPKSTKIPKKKKNIKTSNKKKINLQNVRKINRLKNDQIFKYFIQLVVISTSK